MKVIVDIADFFWRIKIKDRAQTLQGSGFSVIVCLQGEKINYG
jgi:hypothetical protein